MTNAYIIDVVRTPMGRKGGSLADVHPVDLGAHVLSELLSRTGVDPESIDDVIFGCISQFGAQAFNLARNCWLAAGLPESVPGVTIDRQCGSSQQAVHFAAQGIMAGSYQLAIAGGLESMSLVPLNSSAEWGPKNGVGYPFEAEGWQRRYGIGEVHQFAAGELIVDRWGLTRDEMEAFAVRSHERAARAWSEGRFANEVVAIGGFSEDETIRSTSLEAVAQLKPLRDGGRITAGTASQIADGAAVVLLASEEAVAEYGLEPRARVHSMAVAGSDPRLMLTGVIPATEKVLGIAGLGIDEIDLFECNEAFAAVVLAWAADAKVDLERVNVNGGALALGHALGATGVRLLATLVNELERSGARYGLETICEGGGLANATVIERV